MTLRTIIKNAFSFVKMIYKIRYVTENINILWVNCLRFLGVTIFSQITQKGKHKAIAVSCAKYTLISLPRNVAI